ncbi:copper resistance protein CopC [Dietzia sp. B19]|uniref:copper resistance protein CopC n=1 Tax=Dietzia sp. B19 TaxID=1630632 RepID=UPI0015F8DB6B|nr:copper resistance protein CopC [Dietzia sp. B19]
MTPIRARLASTALAATMIVGAASPATVLAPVAAAHSVLVSVDPQDGATLETSPGEVSLTFNEEINQNFASVAVTTGDDRTTLVVGEPTVEGETVTVALDDLADGAYTVGYRVTSADGHVVSGSSVFTVQSAAGTTGDPAEDPVGDQFDQSDPAENQIADETSGEASSGVDPALWVVGGLAVLLIGGAFVLLRRGN